MKSSHPHLKDRDRFIVNQQTFRWQYRAGLYSLGQKRILICKLLRILLRGWGRQWGVLRGH